jgi:dTDP-4-dehydrorhamnose reductase
MKTVLLIGANSFIGKSVARALHGACALVGTYHEKKNPALHRQEQLDIADKRAVKALLQQIKPEVIILVAAVSSTSAPQEQLQRVNVSGVSNVVSALTELQLSPKVIFFSSSQVFDGKTGNYAETDVPNPVNDYGRSKLEGEKFVQAYPDFIIIRCSIVLGPKDKDDHDNFVTTFLKSTQRMTVFKDAFRSPTFVNDIGKVVRAFIERDCRGIIHVSSRESLSYAEMAKRIERVFGVTKAYGIAPCANLNIPKNSSLNADKLNTLIDFPLTTFNDMLIAMKNEGGELS